MPSSKLGVQGRPGHARTNTREVHNFLKPELCPRKCPSGHFSGVGLKPTCQWGCFGLIFSIFGCPTGKKCPVDTFGTLFGFWRVVPTTAWLHWCTIGGGAGSPAPPAVAHNELNQHRRGLQWHNPGRRHRAASHADSTTVATLSLFLRPRPPCQRRWRRCDASRTHDAPTERHTPPSDSSYKVP